MTVLLAPRRVVDGQPRSPNARIRSKTAKSISMTAELHERLRAAAKERGCSMADIVRAACAPILEPEQPR